MNARGALIETPKNRLFRRIHGLETNPTMATIYGLNSNPITDTIFGLNAAGMTSPTGSRVVGLNASNFFGWLDNFANSKLGGAILNIGTAAAGAAIARNIGPGEVTLNPPNSGNIGPAQTNEPTRQQNQPVIYQQPPMSSNEKMMLYGAMALTGVLLVSILSRK